MINSTSLGNTPSTGPQYLMRGFKMLRQTGIRRYAWGPIAINIVMISSLMVFSVDQFSAWTDYLMGSIPSWLGFLEWLLWPIFVLLMLIFIIFTFTMLVNIIGAPFNALLAEHVVERMSGQRSTNATENWRGLAASVPKSLAREFSRLAYTLPVGLLIWVVTLIPAINVISPALWFLWGAWMMSIQYIDYPADNDTLKFKQLRQLLAENRVLTLSFGAAVTVATMIPGINLFVMPAAVCGASIMWSEKLTGLHHN